MKVLIVGLGSIAQKHIHVLLELIPDIELYALRSSKNVSKQEGIINLFSRTELNQYDFHFILVSNPSMMHLQSIKDLTALNTPMMVEKPLFVNLGQVQDFEQEVLSNSFIYVACNFRFHPLINYIKQYLKEKPSKINEVTSYCGSYLPNWRPNQDYRTVYSSRKDLGGGVHLDLIHEPDYLIYLFGKPKSTISKHRKVSNLEIDTYDSSNYLFQYNDFQVHIGLNYFRRDTKRTLEIVREDDTLLVDFVKGELVDLSENKVIFRDLDNSVYFTYKKQMSYFLSCIEENKVPMNSAKEAIEILKCIL